MASEKRNKKTIVMANVTREVSAHWGKGRTKKLSEDSIKVLNLVKTPYAEFSLALLK